MVAQHADTDLIAAAGVSLPREAKVTPMMRQWLEAKARAKGAILLFRMGDFYELFAQDAEEAGPILDLTVTTRDRDKDKDVAIAMAGFPHHAAPAYIAKLIEAGRKVAVCDQLEDPALARGIVKRGVTRVVTPGMVLEEEGLDAGAPNWLVSVCGEGTTWGIAAVDVSTGAFLAGVVESERALVDEVSRLGPPELVLSDDHDLPATLVARLVRRGPGLPERRVELRPAPPAKSLQGKPKPGTALASLKAPLDGWLDERPQRMAKLAAELCASYVLDAQGRLPEHVRAPRPYRPDRLLLLDATTRTHLALVGPAGALRQPGTLFAVVDRTRTAPGGRRLLSMLMAPSCDAATIEARLDVVQAFFEDPVTRARVREGLDGIYDMERITGRAAAGRAGPRELANLRTSLRRVPDVLAALGASTHAALTELAVKLDPLDAVFARLDAALVDEPPSVLGGGVLGGGVLRQGFDPELDRLAALATGGQDAITRVEVEERASTGIPNLKVKYTRVFGYYLEVTKTHLAKVPDHYKRKQTVANAERYVTDELARLEEQVASAEQRAKEREAELFAGLVTEVASSSAALLDLAEALSFVDALASLAEVADAGRWVRPRILAADVRRLSLEEARHPVVEAALKAQGEQFVPSSIELSGDERQLVVVTGPNMAGKSTMMRQVALLQVLAQAGSFVPAARAELSICDRIFTRVGASDDLAQGRSTFMVEMTETAHILKNATPRSLLLLDEIGRGTATFDGLSLAWAVAEHIHDEVGARTLFATHYHELCDLAGNLDRVRNVHVVVKEWNDHIIFTRTLAEGGAERSYGIQVARLAGLPTGVLSRAREVLAELEGDAVTEDARPGPATPRLRRRRAERDQMDLFGPKGPPKSDPYEELARELAEVDTHRLTPLSALNRLDELVREARRRLKG